MLLSQTDGTNSNQKINFGGNDKFNHSYNWQGGNIIHKIRESCYETQIVYLCSGNMGITNCKTALVTKTTFLRLSKKNTEMVHNLFPTDNVNYYITIIITFEKISYLPIITSLILQQSKKSNIKQSRTILINVGEHCVFHF